MMAALRWLRAQQFDRALHEYAGQIVGICGGYQLLGEHIHDPHAVEGVGGEAAGLGLLPVTTVFEANKRTVQVRAQSQFRWAEGMALDGYEIHMGRTQRRADVPSALRICEHDRPDHEDGCVSADGRIWGCYLHGLFANRLFRQAWLEALGWRKPAEAPMFDPYERLADVVETHLDPQQLARLLTG
jgi:adenosylcobyric acid synthase